MNNPRERKVFKIFESKAFLIGAAFIGCLTLSATVLWVAHEHYIDYSSLILDDPNSITEQKLAAGYIAKEDLTLNLYESQGSGKTTKIVPAIREKYLARTDIPDGKVFKRENFGNDTTFTSVDSSYFKKTDYSGGILYDVKGQNDNLTLTPSDPNRFFDNNNYTKDLFYKRTGTGNDTVLTNININDNYLKKSNYDQFFYKKNGSGNNTTLDPVDRSLYSTLSMQCVAPILHNYWIAGYGGDEDENFFEWDRTQRRPFPSEGVELFKFTLSDGSVAAVTTSTVYMFESPTSTSFLDPNKEPFTLERFSSHTFYFVGTVSIDEVYKDEYLAAFTHTITRGANDEITTTRGDLSIREVPVPVGRQFDNLKEYTYDSVKSNSNDALIDSTLLSTYKDQQVYTNWDHWSENCFLTKKVN